MMMMMMAASAGGPLTPVVRGCVQVARLDDPAAFAKGADCLTWV